MNSDIVHFNPKIGVPERLEPQLVRIVAPNPSPMTFRGTNTYLLGESNIAIIDPGPNSEQHLKAILSSLNSDQKISHIFVSHTHLDHSPLAKILSQECGAPIFGYGTSTSGRSTIMTQLANDGFAGGGEGVDVDFCPDHHLQQGDQIETSDWQLEVLHTPGHMGNHISLAWDDACFTADHVMGWASSLISPPDGDLTDFMASCYALLKRKWRRFFPGHGAPVTDPKGRLEWLISHRNRRESEILHTLSSGSASVETIANQIYPDIPIELNSAAQRNVFAHLIDLQRRNRVRTSGPLGQDATFTLRG